MRLRYVNSRFSQFDLSHECSWKYPISRSQLGAKRKGTGSILVEHRGMMGLDASRGNLLKRAVS
ncbi:hypothetical protein NTG1052_660031 [Candidatus Nitrotoga sp. 1052]|nr:hypothetical protein NTG1052_660031 [Candidatus Nitrotoga sp. 1052]